MPEALGSLARIHYGKSPSEVMSPDGEVPVVGTGGVYAKATRSMFDAGVVVARKGSLGQPHLFRSPFWPSDTTYAVLPLPGVDAVWLYYGLLNFDLTKLNEATGVPSISRDWLARIRFHNPGQRQQGAIAAVLTSLDSTIEKTEALIQKHEQIKAGLMHDLFTRGVLPNGELRMPASEAPGLYQSAGGLLVPVDWSIKTLDYACDWYSGGTPTKSNDDWWAGELPWLSPKDMKQFELADTQDHLTRAAALAGSRVMPKGSVFIVVRGMILAHSFPVVLSQAEFAFNQDVKAAVGRASLDNRFLAYWLVSNTEFFLRKMTEATHGTKRLDSKDLYDTVIGIPAPSEQRRIVDRFDAIERRIAADKAHLSHLRIQKLGLMQDLLTGKVRVNVDETTTTT